MSDKITVSALVNANANKTWEHYTAPEHITQWNFADPSWHCPAASNDMRIGGRYFARMEAKDGSFGFDFEAVYTDMNEGNEFSYEFGDRTARVQFNEQGESTEVIVSFDPESENPKDMQRDGWQAILNNFKAYVERS